MTAGVSDSSAGVGCDCIAFCLTRFICIVIKVANLSLNTDKVHKKDAPSIALTKTTETEKRRCESKH